MFVSAAELKKKIVFQSHFRKTRSMFKGRLRILKADCIFGIKTEMKKKGFFLFRRKHVQDDSIVAIEDLHATEISSRMTDTYFVVVYLMFIHFTKPLETFQGGFYRE